MKYIFAVFLLFFANVTVAATFEEMFPDLVDIEPELKTELQKLDYKQGNIAIGGGIATIDINENYYFLDPKDSRYVLEEIWGNPEDATVLGMISPSDKTPYHGGTWAIVLTFDDIGYVSDEDAAGYDFDELLDQIKKDQIQDNIWRKKNGYEAITIVGWAAKPRYDVAQRTLYWAKELEFEGNETNTLNYNIRRLGRKGVLELNFISDIAQLADVEAVTPDIISLVQFSDGNKYKDFRPSLDKVAAIGIGGLIAGKVLAKTGLLVVALVFLKKFWFLVFLPLIWLKNAVFKKNDS